VLPQSLSDIRNAVNIMARQCIGGGKGESRDACGILAIICIGETKSQRQEGKALSACGDQISGSVPEGITSSANAIAYEPLWAIGTASRRPMRRSRRCTRISPVSSGAFRRRREKVRILYGGSVDPINAREILALPEVGGCWLAAKA